MEKKIIVIQGTQYELRQGETPTCRPCAFDKDTDKCTDESATCGLIHYFVKHTEYPDNDNQLGAGNG